MTTSLTKCQACEGYGGYMANIFSPSYATEVKCPVCGGTGLNPEVEIVGIEDNDNSRLDKRAV